MPDSTLVKTLYLHFIAMLMVAASLVMPTYAIAGDQAYDANLPAQLSSDPDLCAYAPCKEVIPGAKSFSTRKGRPPYVEAYQTTAAEHHLVGYVFLSTDIVDIPGYSGQPIVTLIGMDTQGHITGAKVLRHAEPILLLGIPESALTKFIDQYIGKFVGTRLEIGKSQAGNDDVGLNAISSATVTVIAENQVILRSAMAIAKQVGILKPTLRSQAQFTPNETNLDWDTLIKDGSVQRLTVQPEEVGRPPNGQPLIDMYFGDLDAPAVGRSVLGDSGYKTLMSSLKPDEHAIFIIATGPESFKGSGFVRGGIFDRIQVAQDMDTFTFRDIDYANLYSIHAAGAPSYRESAIFIVRSPSFSVAYPWNLVFLANRIDKETGARSFVSFEKEYWLPADYLVGGRPFYERPIPTWLKVWKSRPLEIALFIAFLLAAGATYASRDWLVRHSSRKDKRWVSIPKYTLWAISISFVGYHLLAVPSITQVLTWFHEILFKWNWDLFLSDPFIFLFWWFIIISVFFWGRGMFCGWLCPYGALSEIAHKIGGAIGLKRFQTKLPQHVHDKLKWVKYGVFVGLLAVSFYSMEMAEKLAEIEPFKTTFLVGVWNRSWIFVTYWCLLLAAALFIERPFCKYLCPLGASLAIPSTFRWWGLKRKQECGPCAACENGCESQAINTKGQIDPRECLLCLDCMILYYDDHSCPPLVQERKARIKAGQPLTSIGADGYFIPIIPVDSLPPAVTTPSVQKQGVLAWLRDEAIDHFIPWDREFFLHFQYRLFFKAAGIGLAMLVTWAWLLGGAGQLGTGAILGWWLAWSAYELVTRMICKPRVKEGPWWGRKLRPATWADMAAYVAMKNLLIGAALFLAMRGIGVLDVLHGLPELRWLY